MRTDDTWLSWLAGAVIGIPLLTVAACYGLYAWSGRDLPDTFPAVSRRAPDIVRAQFLAIETGGATHLRRLNPVTFWAVVTRHDDVHHTAPDLRLLLLAAHHAKHRHWSGHGTVDWHAASIAATVDIGRQWTFDEAVDTLLAGSEFGRDSIGIEAAAQAWFGVSASALRPQESLALIVLMRAPSWYAPDCHRERFERRCVLATDMLGNTGPAWTPTAALSRMRPAICRRGA